jgi:hypothetical protein
MGRKDIFQSTAVVPVLVTTALDWTLITRHKVVLSKTIMAYVMLDVHRMRIFVQYPPTYWGVSRNGFSSCFSCGMSDREMNTILLLLW